MSLIDIKETVNENVPKQKPLREKFDVYIPNVAEGLSRRNGMIYVISGSGGSGKTNLLLNMFKSTKLYRMKFDNIFYICPMSSFLSVEKHPFANHDKVHHELTLDLLESIYNQLDELKESQEEPHYSCVIIDDFADSLKDVAIQKQLNKMLIKARHIQCSFIFMVQSYYYFPKILRKQITYLTLFKSKNKEEFETLTKELICLNKDNAQILYDYVFDQPYTHLDIDTVENKYYKNFNPLELIFEK